MRNSSTRRLGAMSLVTLLLLALGLVSPALAGAKGGEKADRGDRPSVSGSTDDDSRPEEQDPDVNLHPSGKDRHEDNGTQGKSTSEPDDNGSGPERDYQGTDKPFVDGDGPGGLDTQDQDGNNGCGNDDDFEDDNEGWCGQKPKKTTTPPVVGGGNTTKPEPECPKRNEMGDTHGQGPKDCKDEPVCTDDMSTKDVDECDDDETEVGGEVITPTCPKAGETLPAGTTMPAGCTTTTPTGTVTSETLATNAVLGTDLQNGSAAAAIEDSATVMGVQLERTTPAAVAAGAATAPAGTSVLGAALARTGLSFTVIALAIALGLLAVGFTLKRAGRTQSDF